MGLDMYLFKIKKGTSLNAQPVTEVAYWRKANQIHKWFVDNVQSGVDNCAPYHVPLAKLIELRELCKDIQANCLQAEEALPTQAGFFFGGTDYDQYYFDDLKSTIDQLSDVHLDQEHDYYYQSSW